MSIDYKGRKRVLVIDGAEDTKRSFRYALDRKYYWLFNAIDLSEGLDLIKRRAPDLVVVSHDSLIHDFLGGISAIRILHKNRPLVMIGPGPERIPSPKISYGSVSLS